MSELTVRQNYHEESEQGVNGHINVELCAFYTYLSMVSSLLHREYRAVYSIKLFASATDY